MVGSYFAGESVVVDAYSSGEAALDAMAVRAPDLLILDLMMPGLSGFDVIAAVRSRASTADLPVIVLSAKELSAAERRELASSARAVFAKASTGRVQLLAEVRRLLRGRGALPSGST